MSFQDKEWEEIRASEFPGLIDSAPYLNAAAIGPLPEKSIRAAHEFNQKRAHVHEMKDEDFFAPSTVARRAAAELINAGEDEIALGTNTSFGLNLVAAGLDFPSGSRVVISDREFPANVYPWMDRTGYELDIVPTTPEGWPDEDALLARLTDPSVAVLAISSVQFASGYRADLNRLGQACRDSETLFVVDAIQSLGCIPLDVRETPVDVVAAGGHKWMLGPLGVGFAYVRREVQRRIRPAYVGWPSLKASGSVDNLLDYEFDFVEDARRFEMATAPLQDQLAFASSVSLLTSIGVDRIWARVDELLAPLREMVDQSAVLEARSPQEDEHRSGIFSFHTPDDEQVIHRLKEAGCVISLREGGIRIAPHFYNTESDIATVTDLLREMEKEWM